MMKKKERFVQIKQSMYESESWKTLSPGAKCIYLAIRQRFNGRNNGEISLSCREAAAVINGGKGTARKRLKELLCLGFIKVAQKGHFSFREATTWILTNEKVEKSKPTNEWKDWRDGMDFWGD